MYTDDEKIAVIFGVILIVVIIVLIILHYLERLKGFEIKMCYINMEIKRTKGKEQKYWKRQKKRLLLSLLPFYNYRR